MDTKGEITIPGFGLGKMCICPKCKEWCAVEFPATINKPIIIKCRSNSIVKCGFYSEKLKGEG
jgi:hypothetical protein